MNKNVLLVYMLTATLFLCACAPRGEAAPSAAPTAVATPAPTPEPAGMERVFGRDRTLAYWGDDLALLSGAQWEADRLGVPLVTVFSPEEANEADVVIAAYGETGGLMALSRPVILITDDKKAMADADRSLYYDPDGQAADALAALLAYPGHEAPVRVIGLFSQEGGQAAKAFSAMEKEGKLLSRGVCYESDPEAAEAWLLETLANVTPGLLDSVYAETPALALAAAAALEMADRQDAVEVIAAELDADVLLAMGEAHSPIGAAVGVNAGAAGALSVRVAVAQLAGEETEEVYTLPRETITKAALAAASEAGAEHPIQAAIGLSEGLAGLCMGEAAAYLATERMRNPA